MLEVAAEQKIFVAKLTAHMSLNRKFKINVMPKVMEQQQKRKTHSTAVLASTQASPAPLTIKQSPDGFIIFPLYFPNPWP